MIEVPTSWAKRAKLCRGWATGAGRLVVLLVCLCFYVAR
jgi:hypothetical protein